MDATAGPVGTDPDQEVAASGRSAALQRRLLALVLWTVLVWATRIDNIVSDDGLTGVGKIGRVALAGSFLALAALAGTEWWAARGRPTVPSRYRVRIAPLAAWTICVWAIRATGIALGDHDATFIAVHLVLAAASIALAALVLVARPRALPGTAGPALS